jgi:hypothetical protein
MTHNIQNHQRLAHELMRSLGSCLKQTFRLVAYVTHTPRNPSTIASLYFVVSCKQIDVRVDVTPDGFEIRPNQGNAKTHTTGMELHDQKSLVVRLQSLLDGFGSN